MESNFNLDFYTGGDFYCPFSNIWEAALNVENQDASLKKHN